MRLKLFVWKCAAIQTHIPKKEKKKKRAEEKKNGVCDFTACKLLAVCVACQNSFCSVWGVHSVSATSKVQRSSHLATFFPLLKRGRKLRSLSGSPPSTVACGSQVLLPHPLSGMGAPLAVLGRNLSSCRAQAVHSYPVYAELCALIDMQVL